MLEIVWALVWVAMAVAIGSALVLRLVSSCVTGFFVYVLTGRDLRWHLAASLNRLFVQAWPCLIVTLFAALRPAEES
jgi:hypothetical protein